MPRKENTRWARSFAFYARPAPIPQVAGFTLTAVLTLAFGIGPTAVTFSIIEGVLLRPYHFADPATLVALGHVAGGAESNGAPNVSASQVITLFP